MKLTEAQKHQIRIKIEHLKQERKGFSMSDHDRKGRNKAEIEELQDILEGKPGLQDLTDEELEIRYREAFDAAMKERRKASKLGSLYLTVDKPYYLSAKLDMVREEQKRRKQKKEAEKASAYPLMTGEFMHKLTESVFSQRPDDHFQIHFRTDGIYVKGIQVTEGTDNTRKEYEDKDIFIMGYPFAVSSPDQLLFTARQYEEYVLSVRSLKKFDLWPKDSENMRKLNYAYFTVDCSTEG